MNENRRRHKRDRVLKEGQIVFHHGQCTVNCAVVDISASGARVRVDTALGLPEHFELRLYRGPAYTCRVVWNQGNTLGVEFVFD